MTFDLGTQLTLLGHSTALTTVSPLSNLFQLTKLYEKPFLPNAYRVFPILPLQIGLRYFQINASFWIKTTFHLEQHETVSTFLAFGVLGVLQGGVSKAMAIAPITKSLSIVPFFRGSSFGFGRDLISQGLPFYLGRSPLEVLGWSLVSTFVSHPLHLGQTLMQSDRSMTCSRVPSHLKRRLGWHMFTSGMSARLGLLTVTNLLNFYLLKDVLA